MQEIAQFQYCNINQMHNSFIQRKIHFTLMPFSWAV